jgi:DNA-binding transcriptional LysR family regulator
VDSSAIGSDIEPSPLSRAIREFETRLGVCLLHRNKGSVQLTWPDTALEENAKAIALQVENAGEPHPDLCRVPSGLASSVWFAPDGAGHEA